MSRRRPGGRPAARRGGRSRARARRAAPPAADSGRGGWNPLIGILAATVAMIGVPATLIYTPWMGRGLAELFPSQGAQRAVPIGLGLVLAGCVVGRVHWSGATRYRLGAVACAAGIILFLVAPVGRGHGLPPGSAVGSVETLVRTGYLVWLGLAALLVASLTGGAVYRWWRRRTAPPGAAVPQSRPLPPWTVDVPFRPSVLIAVGIPLAFALLTVGVGAGVLD